MRTILVFTNQDSLSFKKKFLERTDVLFLNKINEILYFNEQNSLFEISTSFDKPGLYFVIDSIGEDHFNELCKKINKSNCYILKHKLPKFNLYDFAEIQVGQHENNGQLYPAIISIFLDGKFSETNRIFDEVFKVDPEIEFLLKPFENNSPFKNNSEIQNSKVKIQNKVKTKYNL